jgi:prepilin-type processing-associated H-X9-DG protein
MLGGKPGALMSYQRRSLPVIRPRATGAFTLLELLLVVCVLAILAAMLMPGVSLVRASARSVNCQNNQAQIHLAILGYTTDYSGRLPVAYYAGNNTRGGWNNGGFVSFDDQLGAYDGRNLSVDAPSGADRYNCMFAEGINLNNFSMKSAALRLYNLYRCPAETAQDPTLSTIHFIRSYVPNRAYIASGTRDSVDGRLPSGVKGIFAMPAGATGYGWSARTAQISRPSETILLAEVRGVYARLGSSMSPVADIPFSGPVTQGVVPASNPSGMLMQIQSNSEGYFSAIEPLHRKRWNYLFCDGHVRSLTPEETIDSGRSTLMATTAGSMWWR